MENKKNLGGKWRGFWQYSRNFHVLAVCIHDNKSGKTGLVLYDSAKLRRACAGRPVEDIERVFSLESDGSLHIRRCVSWGNFVRGVPEWVRACEWNVKGGKRLTEYNWPENVSDTERAYLLECFVADFVKGEQTGQQFGRFGDYTPDVVLILPDGTVVYIEVKGYHARMYKG